MPKLSLSRRHRRRSNLALLSVQTEESTLSKTTPRKVSEEDISFSSDHEESKLKRPASNYCLVGMLPATPSYREQTDDNGPSASPCSPWGHFVDLLTPSSDSEEEDKKARYQPLLPSTTSLRDQNEPYPLKRRRLYHAVKSDLKGFLLSSPEIELDEARGRLVTLSMQD